MGKLKIWANEEDQILIEVSRVAKSKKWKRASQQLKRNGFERSDVQCRQRYINHLDPGVNKQLWSPQELQIMYSKYHQYGNKWFILQKYLPGRTQTKIKNCFYGNIRYLIKIIIKFYLKTSTGFINDIKTDTLLDIYQGKNKFSGQDLIQRTIHKMNFHIDKKLCQEIIRRNSFVYETFVHKFMQNFSQNSNLQTLEKSIQEQNSQKNQSIQMGVSGKNSGFSRKIQLVTSIGGTITHIDDELQYLKALTEKYSALAQRYHQAYQTLSSIKEDKSSTSQEAIVSQLEVQNKPIRIKQEQL